MKKSVSRRVIGLVLLVFGFTFLVSSKVSIGAIWLCLVCDYGCAEFRDSPPALEGCCKECNDEPPCVPVCTGSDCCSYYGMECGSGTNNCGTVFDGCGTTYDCGTCDPGFTCCDYKCVNLSIDVNHCGNCNNTCPSSKPICCD